MDCKLILVLLGSCFLALVNSQSAPQVDRTPHVQSVQVQHTSPSLDSGITSGKNQQQNQNQVQNQNQNQQNQESYTPYAYRSTQSGYQNQNQNQNQNQQSYPAATFSRDAYGSSREASGTPLLGVSSTADFQLSAYFGQIFWAFVACSLTLVVSIWLIRYFAGTDVVGGIVDKINSGATGKAMDLDRITNMVYQAFDTYGKYAAKEARHVAEIGNKVAGR